MIKYCRFFIFIFIFSFLFSCKQEKESIDSPVVLTERQPLSIPKNLRIQQYLRGNLVVNPSFETGKYFYEDSLIGSFDLKGWKKLGNNVEWITNHLDSTIEIENRNGKHSIKINREEFNEVDEMGDGIISDFIKVIPGNYSLTFDIKLHHIVSNLRRFGMKLYDAVNIRLFFYDKNKLPVDAASYNTFTKSTVDKSFKGYSFSNFREIRKFDWGRVDGKSYNHPELEGNIPVMAKYVKIFLGLKGKGTMWVDNVNFSYTKLNLTPLERYQQYFDSTYSNTRLIVPTPQKLETLDEIKYYGDNSLFKSEPVILIPARASREILSAANLIKNKLNHIFNVLSDTSGVAYIRIISEIGEDEASTDAMIISIGPSILFKINKKGLPVDEIKEYEQSYFIKNIPKVPNVLYLYGNDPISNYYAATTFVQMFDQYDYIFYNASILDYPDFLKRSYFLSNRITEQIENSIHDMSLNKFNSLYCDASENSRSIKEMMNCSKTNFTDVSLVYLMDSYVLHDVEINELDQEVHYKQNYKRSVIEKLNKDIVKGLKMGIRTILIQGAEHGCYQPGNSAYYLLKGKTLEEFVKIQNADAFMLNFVNKTLKRYSNSKVQFLPIYYSREQVANSNGLGEQYFQDLVFQISEDVSLLWSGNTSYSLSLNMADLLYFNNISGKIPVYIDNSFLADSLSCFYIDEEGSLGMLRKHNIFLPFQGDLPKNFHLNTEGRQMIINKFPHGEVDKIRLATVADYMWNTTAYDPDFSLWKVLVSRFSKNVAIELLLLNDDYSNLYDLCNKIVKERIKGRYLKEGESIIIDMNSRFELFQKELDDRELFSELQLKKDAVINLFQKLIVE